MFEDFTAGQLDESLARLARQGRKIVARIAFGLLEMKRRKLHRDLGYGSLADYAQARLYWSGRKMRELMGVAEVALKVPAFQAEFEAGNIHWTKLRTIAGIVSEENAEEWLAKARELSSTKLEREVARAKGRPVKVRIVLEFEEEEYAEWEDMVRGWRQERKATCSYEQAVLGLMKRGAPRFEGIRGPVGLRTVIHKCEECESATRETREGPVEVAPSLVARAACDGEVVDARTPRRLTKTIPTRVRRFVLARDRGRCVVPGCTCMDFVEVHHVVPRAQGGTHDPEMLATLCTGHHAAVHEGKVTIERVDGRFVVHAHVSMAA